MSETKKNKAGRPKKFTKEWLDGKAESIPAIMENGDSLAHVAVELGMSLDTLHECKKESELFSDALKRGVTLSEKWWVNLGRDLTNGEVKGNATTWIFNMKNRFNWRDSNKEYVPADLSGCKDNLERMIRIIDLTAKGELSMQDAALYRNLLRSFSDEELIQTMQRVKALEKLANGV